MVTTVPAVCADYKRLLIMPGLKNQESQESKGEYQELARLVREITGNVTRQVAANHSGISHDTIARMWRGEKVSEAMLIRFATGYRTNPNPLLKAAGYDLLPVSPSKLLNKDSNQEASAAQFDELERVPDEDAVFFIETFEGASPQSRELLKAMAEKVREMDSRHSIGGRGGKD